MTDIDIVKKLDSLSFNSLDSLEIDWRKIIKNNPELEKDYLNYLSLKKNWIIVNCDYSQLELYVLASISGDKNMIATVNSGKDIHSENTKKIHGIDYEALEAENKNSNTTPARKKELEFLLKDFKAKRKSTKGLSFSLTYGAGPEKISMDNKITMPEAQKLIDGFYNIYPGVKIWQEATFLSAIKLGYIETPFGRRRATPKVQGRTDAYKALVQEDKKVISKMKHEGEYWSLRNEFKTCKNTPIQSVASDMCSLAACKFKDWLKTVKDTVKAEMYFWIHDSIVFAVHIDDAILVIEKLRDIMENQVKYPGDPVNYRSSLEVGYNYEFVSEIDRNTWIAEPNKKELILGKLNEALDLDAKKKFKLIVKSSSLEMDEKYLKNIKESKESYFEKLCEKLNIDGVYDPQSYMCIMNDCSVEEYEDAMNLDEDEEDE